MKYKLNIIEPWESGTKKAIAADILKDNGKEFLLFVGEPINVRGIEAQYFICKFKTKILRHEFYNNLSGVYEISMVYDKEIKNANHDLPDIESYRSNFLSGELII